MKMAPPTRSLMLTESFETNSIWLLNRWTAARQSPDAEATYGGNITQVLRGHPG